MLLQEITMIARMFAAIMEQAARPGSMEQRRAAQVADVIGAVDDVAGREAEDGTIAGKRVDEAHDIIHRIAAILAMEPDEAVPEMPYDPTDTRERISVEEAVALAE